MLRLDGDGDLPSLFALTPGTQEAPNDGTKPARSVLATLLGSREKRSGMEWHRGIFGGRNREYRGTRALAN